jgi:hypothetical protein
LLSEIRKFASQQIEVDLIVCNYIYDKINKRRKHAVRYGKALPENRVISWDDVGKFRFGRYILMHAAVLRTELLQKSHVSLPRHTFYVDNLYIYSAMKAVETLYYLNVDLYHYYIGREDQSVYEDVMIRRIDQQILVNKLMVEQVDVSAIQNTRKKEYMTRYLEIVTIISSVMLIRSNLPENIEKKDELWAFIKEAAPDEYESLRRGLFGRFFHLPVCIGSKLINALYGISRRVVGFN